MIKKMFFGVLAISMLTISCNNDDDNNGPSFSTLSLNLNGLEDLGADFVYEGWIIVNGSPVSTGTFTVDATGNLSETNFSINSEMLSSAATFVLSIEPANDTDPAPAAAKILAGDFSGNSAAVSTGLVGDFTSSAGKYILATPTNGSDNDENSGIWFLDLSSGSPSVGLNLPTLPDGWEYEGWVVKDGMPITSGKFTALDMVDGFDGFSSTMNPGPPFPGEDYLMNAPSGVTFPFDLAGGTAVISIEPVPDNSPAPFTLKPLASGIPTDATDHVTYDLSQNLTSLPTGTVSR